MLKNVPFALLALLSVCASGCGDDHKNSSGAPSAASTRSSDTSTAAVVPIPLNKESDLDLQNPADADALRYAYSIWLTRATPYKDSFISKSTPVPNSAATTAPAVRYAQLKGVTVSGNHLPIQKADELNGVDWTAAFSFGPEAVRNTDDQGQWSKWRSQYDLSGGTPFASVYFVVQRTKGKWESNGASLLFVFQAVNQVAVAVKPEEIPPAIREGLDKDSGK